MRLINTLSEIENFVESFANLDSLEVLIYNIKTQLEFVAQHDTTGLYLYNEEEHKLKLFYAKGFSEEEKLNAELTAGPKAAKQKQIEGSITRLTKALENMKIELPNVEAKLTTIRASRTPIKRGRPAGITGFVSSLFSPAKV